MTHPPLTRVRRIDTKIEGKVNLLISGFGLQSIVEVDELVNTIANLPATHISRLQVIKYDPTKRIPFLIRHQRVGPQLGEYLNNFDSIVIYRFDSRQECFHVVFHEIGHHVYFRHIGSQLKKRWVTEVYRSEPGISRVGMRNACEDFAECYACFLTNPERLKNYPSKFLFFKELFNK